MQKEEKQTKETMVDMVCKNVRRDIITHELSPGQRIHMKELAKRYGTSEMPVKLAMNRLIAEQIVENFPRQGMRIKAIDIEEAKEIFELRRMMDLYYTREIIEAVHTDKKLQKALELNVEEHYKVMKEYSDSNNVEKYLENYMRDNEFHELYLKCSGNRKLVEMYRNINPFVFINFIYSRQTSEKDLSGVEEHRAIVQAILKKDEELLKKCVAEHTDNALRAILVLVKTDKIL